MSITRITRLVALALAALLAVSLAGCGAGKPDTTSTPPAKQESAAELFSKGKNLPGLTYDYVMTMKDGPGMTGKVWVSGKKMKTEIMMEKQQVITFFDGEANVLYNYMPAQAMLMKVPFDPSKASKSPDQYVKDTDAAKVKLLETVVYDGVSCKLTLLEEKEAQRQIKLWVRQDYGIPMKVEVTEAGSVKMVADYKNIKVGSLPPEIFALPKGVPVTDMSEMMKQLPAKPAKP